MASSATVRVDKATSDLLLGPDWTMNMEICDSINSDPGLAKEVLKAVKKRLQHKSPRVQFLALTLLETMIKNCGDFIHFQVVERDILQEMVKIVKKKTDMEVRDKILVLLDSWQEAFGGSGGKYPQYFWAYTDLKRSGVDFPNRPSDATLMFTPPTHQAATTRIPHVGHGMPIDSPMRLDQAMASESANLSLSDLDRIRSVMELLNDMLKAVNPRDREAVQDEVIKDLVDQCRSNQKKILQMIDSTGDEELLGQGLAMNDNLQSVLAKHAAIASASPFPEKASESALTAPTTISANCLFEDEEDDDEFAQLARRNTKTNQNSTGSNDTGEVSSSMGAHPLALPDPPPPVRTTTKEQNIFDLLTITLSSNSPSHTPISPLNAYAAPWAQPPPPPSLHSPARPHQYPPPPWEDAPSTNPNPFAQSTHTMQYSSFNPAAGASQKPFVPSYRLFEDLVDAKNPNGAVKAGSSSGQGMAYGRD